MGIQPTKILPIKRISKDSGLSERTVRKAFKGSNATRETIDLISKAVEIEVQELFFHPELTPTQVYFSYDYENKEVAA